MKDIRIGKCEANDPEYVEAVMESRLPQAQDRSVQGAQDWPMSPSRERRPSDLGSGLLRTAKSLSKLSQAAACVGPDANVSELAEANGIEFPLDLSKLPPAVVYTTLPVGKAKVELSLTGKPQVRPAAKCDTPVRFGDAGELKLTAKKALGDSMRSLGVTFKKDGDRVVPSVSLGMGEVLGGNVSWEPVTNGMSFSATAVDPGELLLSEEWVLTGPIGWRAKVTVEPDSKEGVNGGKAQTSSMPSWAIELLGMAAVAVGGLLAVTSLLEDATLVVAPIGAAQGAAGLGLMGLGTTMINGESNEKEVPDA